MIKHEIIITLNNVSREEQQELRDYLENNCWGWKERERKECFKIKKETTIGFG